MGKDKKKDRKLYDAVKSSNLSLVEQLLAEGADPDAPVGKKGMTSMHRAATLATHDIEDVLLRNGGTMIHKPSRGIYLEYYCSA